MKHTWQRSIMILNSNSHNLERRKHIVHTSEKECFIDRSRNDKNVFSGQGWYITVEDFEGLMETKNAKQSLSPLHAKLEAFIWVLECKKIFRQFSCDFCNYSKIQFIEK